MKTKFLAALALSVTCIAWAADPNPASNTASAPSQEEVVAQFKKDLMADRAQVMAKGLKLDAQQAAKFWPLFETFQKEQAAIVDAQTKALKDTPTTSRPSPTPTPRRTSIRCWIAIRKCTTCA